MSYKVTLDTRKLQALRKELIPLAEKVIDKTAFDIEQSAKRHCPVDTGALRSSIYTVTSRESGESDAQQNARLDNPDVELETIPAPRNRLEARVGPSVNYAIYVHWGTVKMRYSRPFLLLAVEDYRPYFLRAWDAMLRKYE